LEEDSAHRKFGGVEVIVFSSPVERGVPVPIGIIHVAALLQQVLRHGYVPTGTSGKQQGPATCSDVLLTCPALNKVPHHRDMASIYCVIERCALIIKTDFIGLLLAP